MLNTENDDPGAVVTCTIACAVCGETAARLTYVPRGTAHDAAYSLPETQNCLVVDGFLGTLVTQVIGDGTPVLHAVRDADPAALWLTHALWAPFYCPACGVSYCERHWTTHAEFDDEDPGWYDHTVGVCPRGHQRIVDD
jgi:hypothetical protein